MVRQCQCTVLLVCCLFLWKETSSLPARKDASHIEERAQINRPKRSLRAHPFKWDKQIITWKIVNYTNDLPPKTTKRLVRRALKEWSRWIPLSFRQARTGAQADIKISFVKGDHSDCVVPFASVEGNIAHAYLPHRDLDRGGDIHINDAYDFRNDRKLAWTLLHELGHSLGLQHSHNGGAVMSHRYLQVYNSHYYKYGLRKDDIMRIQRLYGKKEQPQNEILVERPWWTTIRWV